MKTLGLSLLQLVEPPSAGPAGCGGVGRAVSNGRAYPIYVAASTPRGCDIATPECDRLRKRDILEQQFTTIVFVTEGKAK